MDTIELKNSLHHIIDSTDNANLLSRFHSLLTSIKNHPEGKLWARLSKEEKEELMKANIESNDPENLIPQFEMEKKHKRWLLGIN